MITVDKVYSRVTAACAYGYEGYLSCAAADTACTAAVQLEGAAFAFTSYFVNELLFINIFFAYCKDSVYEAAFSADSVSSC